jgi:RNA polymerase sigma factor (sigma-70 family)
MLKVKNINELVSTIYSDPLYLKTLYNIVGKSNYNLIDDFWQDLMLYFLNYKDPEKFVKIYNDNHFKYYIVKIMLNQMNSKSSPFYKKYKLLNFDFFDFDLEMLNNTLDNDNINIYYNNTNNNYSIFEMQESETELFLDEIIMIEFDEWILTQKWHERELFNMYFFKKMSYRKISKETSIPLTSVYLTITTSLEDFKKHLKEKNIYK